MHNVLPLHMQALTIGMHQRKLFCHVHALQSFQSADGEPPHALEADAAALSTALGKAYTCDPLHAKDTDHRRQMGIDGCWHVLVGLHQLQSHQLTHGAHTFVSARSA